jgi:hypothetical protein
MTNVSQPGWPPTWETGTVINAFVSLAAVIAVLVGQAATPTPATYYYNVFVSGAIRYQNPDLTACTAAMTQSMLNTIYYNSAKPLSAITAVQAAQPSLAWTPTLTYKSQSYILRYERSHMTMSPVTPGSDVHGWRNALNFYGWGSIDAGVYADLSYKTFDEAAKATVHEIAMTNEPVGILSEFGSHAAMATGYSVTGADPRTGSLDFKVNGVYLTDPLRERRVTNHYFSYQEWKFGPPLVRFWPFEQVDSVIKDPIDGQVGVHEWWRKFVIVAPAGVQ